MDSVAVTETQAPIDQAESEGDRRTQTFWTNSSSPLFYTVSEWEPNRRKNYFVEQLGCPSIIKPNFRDNPASVRSLGLSKCSKETCLQKSSKMRKSTKSQDLRFRSERLEKFTSPIRVNTVIQHTYSELTTASPNSSVISYVSAETQTDLPPIVNPSNSRDASTSTTPPPIGECKIICPQSNISLPPLLVANAGAGAGAGKFDDLEKITGHILIQRFFTKADEAFGFWMEKQLKINTKSGGIESGESTKTEKSESTTLPTIPLISSKLGKQEEIVIEKEYTETQKFPVVPVSTTIEEKVPVLEAKTLLEDALILKEVDSSHKLCKLNDVVKCECFLNDKTGKDSWETVCSTSKQEILTENPVVELTTTADTAASANQNDVTPLYVGDEAGESIRLEPPVTSLPASSQVEELITPQNEESETEESAMKPIEFENQQENALKLIDVENQQENSAKLTEIESQIVEIEPTTNQSRSDRSSLKNQISENGDDADESESASEILADDNELGVEAITVDDNDEGDGSSEAGQLDQFDTIIENHEKSKASNRPFFRKRNESTQTLLSPSGSSISSRSTATNSQSSFDLEFVSTKKYYLHQKAEKMEQSEPRVSRSPAQGLSKRRSYLPNASSGLNSLNVRFTVGKEFESEVSMNIRQGKLLPHSQGKSKHLGNSGVQENVEIRELWRYVKSKMENVVADQEFLVTGNKITLTSEFSPSTSMKQVTESVSVQPPLSTVNEERLKKSLKIMKQILDD